MQQPFIIQGYIYDKDGNELSGATVIFIDKNGESLETTLAGSFYAFDCANFSEDYSVGDTVTIVAEKKTKGKKTETVAITNEAGITKNITLGFDEYDVHLQENLGDYFRKQYVIICHADGTPVSDGYPIKISGTRIQATFTANGSDCTGNDGDKNRVLVLDNTKLSSQEQVVVNGLTLHITADYTITHKSSNTEITFLNKMWDSSKIAVRYFYAE